MSSSTPSSSPLAEPAPLASSGWRKLTQLVEPIVLLVPSGVWLLLLLVAPTLLILELSLIPGFRVGQAAGGYGIGNYIEAFQPIYFQVILRSILFAVGSTVICMLLGFPVAYWIAIMAPIRWRNLLLVLFVLPLWTSSLLRAYAWITILRPSGVLNSLLNVLHLPNQDWLNQTPAVYIGMAYSFLPYMVLILYASLEKLDRRLLEAASDLGAQAITYLRSTAAIRDRCGQLFALAEADRLEHFRLDLSQLDAVANYVLEVMRSNYPTLQVPFHSRWRHFEAGGIPRPEWLDAKLNGLDPLEKARAKFDLAITSVLLDAGAGADWRFSEAETGLVLGRSEGLAIASFELFLQGGFSSDPAHPFQADALGLQNLTESAFTQAFQVTAQNPLVGVAGRLGLMQRLGRAIAQQPELFGSQAPRLGNLVDYLMHQAVDHQLKAHDVFAAVLEGLSEIWAGRVAIAGLNLGDVWIYEALPDQGIGAQLVPFHKLSQWLTYSLLEPLQELGLQIIDLDELTGLSEYRNGGLCLDLGLLQPKHKAVTAQAHAPDSSVIIEWRSLTVILLDRIAEAIRAQLQLDATQLPLAKVLEGGTWAAGRKIAAELRAGGVPPIQIISDGTVF